MGGCLSCQKQSQMYDKINPPSINNHEIITQSSTTIASPEKSKLSSVTMDDFQPIKLLGKGSFGKVILVKYFNNNNIYAMKILKKEEIIKRNQIKHTQTERFLLEKLDHPFIAQLQFAFQDTQKLYLVTEFLQGGELFFHLKRKSCFKEYTAKFYMAQIFLAIDYMHKNGYIYRDLKPENILLDKEGYIKLTDFGLSKIVLNKNNNDDENDIGKSNTVCGTLDYMAPEILMGKNYDKSIDWFSFGILLYELICGSFPFKVKNRKIEESIYKEKITFPENISEAAKDLILKLLEIDPEKRLGYNNSDEIKNSEFFKNINFDKMYNKEYRPPFRPKLSGKIDLKYFDINFIENNEELYSEDLSDNNNKKEDNNKEQVNVESFEGFSFMKDDGNNNNVEEDEDDDYDL